MAKYKCTVNTISPGAATRMTIDLIKAAGRDVDVNDWKQGTTTCSSYHLVVL